MVDFFIGMFKLSVYLSNQLLQFAVYHWKVTLLILLVLFGPKILGL